MKCSICGKDIKGYGNNPAPLKRDACCDECNAKVIIPLRMYLNEMNTKQLMTLTTDGCIKISEKMKEAPLERLQELVGGYITIYPKQHPHFLFLVDEEGLLKKREFNKLAYEILGIEVVGNVVICPRNLFK